MFDGSRKINFDYFLNFFYSFNNTSFLRNIIEIFSPICCTLCYRTGFKLFLPCNCGWWRRHCSFTAFQQALGRAPGKGWTRGSEIGAYWAEHQSFVQEQRQLERSSTRSRPDVGEVLSFCSGEAGFRARRHLYEVCIVASQACGFNPLVLSHPSLWLCYFRFSS